MKNKYREHFDNQTARSFVRPEHAFGGYLVISVGHRSDVQPFVASLTSLVRVSPR